MRQAVHIFLKDSRQFRYPIALLLAWVCVFVVAAARVPVLATYDWTEVVVRLSEFLLPIGWCYLVAEAIQAEALPGDRQFWLTRPYRRSSLAGAKALFVLAYVLFPLAIAQATIVVLRGIPLGYTGLLSTNLLMLAAVVLPTAAVAALTPNLTRFVLIALPAVTLGLANGFTTRWLGIEWVRTGIAIVGILLVAGVVLFLQYSRRWTDRSRLIALAGVLVVLVVQHTFPWTAAFALQARTLPAWDGSITAELARPQANTDERNRPPYMAHFHFRLRGQPPGAPITCESGRFSLTSAEGAGWTSDWQHDRGRATHTSSGCLYSMRLPDAFVEAVGTQPVALAAELFVTVFGAERLTAVPLDQPTLVDGFGLCSATKPEVRGVSPSSLATILTCEGAFRGPRGLLSAVGSGPLVSQSTFESYMPLPGGLVVRPTTSWRWAVRGPEVLLASRDPVAHVKVKVEAQDLRVPDPVEPLIVGSQEQ
jgi:hypothetical protein